MPENWRGRRQLREGKCRGPLLRGLFYAVPDFSTPPPRFLAKARTGASVEMTVVEVAA